MNRVNRQPADDDKLSDTIDLQQSPVMDTAEFEALIELQSELFDDKAPDD